MAKKNIDFFLFVSLVTIVIFLSVFPADIILPALPSLSLEYNVSISDLSLSITFYLIFFGIGALFYGPISDKFSKKIVFIIGLFIALVGSLICYFSQSYITFFAGRAIEALGSASFIIIHSIIKNDFDENIAHKLRIYIVTLSGIFISCAPTMGAFIVDYIGWRFIFLFFSISVLFSIFFSIRVLKHEPSNKKEISNPYKGWKPLFNKPFLTYAICGTLAFCFHFSFIVSSPQIMINFFHLSIINYGFVMLAYGVAYIVGGYISKQIAKKHTIDKQFYIGVIIISIGVLSLGSVFILYSIATYMIVMIIITTGVSMVMSSAMTIALRASPNKSSGKAITLLTFIRFGCAGTIISLGSIFLFHYKYGFICNCFILLGILFLTLLFCRSKFSDEIIIR